MARAVYRRRFRPTRRVRAMLEIAATPLASVAFVLPRRLRWQRRARPHPAMLASRAAFLTFFTGPPAAVGPDFVGFHRDLGRLMNR